MATLVRILRLPLLFLGLALLFAAERYLSAWSSYKLLKYSGLALSWLSVVLAILLRADAGAKGRVGEAHSWTYLALWQALVAAGASVYLLYAARLSSRASPDTFAEKALLAVWLLLLVIGFCQGIGLELAHRSSGQGPLAEPSRVLRAGQQWTLIGMVAAALVALNFAAAKQNMVYDWSYLKTTVPGESTVKMVKLLDKELEVSLFFPGTNEVKPMVLEYFAALAKLEPQIKLSQYDTDLNPIKAEELKVSRNGQVVLQYKGLTERIDIGLDLKRARTSLAKLDSLFQKSFLAVSAKKRVAYFTSGHGEMSWNQAEAPAIRATTGLEQIMRMQNYSVRFFGTTDGSLTKVPDDATSVAIIGPTKPFLKEEVEVLKAYVERGGSLFVLLDVDTIDFEDKVLVTAGEDPLQTFLSEVGLKYQAVHLAHEQSFVTATRTKVDKWFLYSNVFSSHESVQSLARHDERIQVLAFQTGYFEITPQVGAWKSTETVKALAGTFTDVNRDTVFNEGTEQRGSLPIGAAAEGINGKGKIIAYADATMVSDALLRNAGNQLLIVDAIKWLSGDSATAGEINTEEDVKIQHSRSRELFGFYGSILAVPLLLLGIGFFATRNRMKGGR